VSIYITIKKDFLIVIYIYNQEGMRIRLKNIKCYEDERFDFGSEGMALLSGDSGKGKSTIIQGIYFALFGTGSKITMAGKNSCSVELEFDGMTIHRSKNPSKLMVNNSVEDDAAQELINRKFGSTFDVTGYIPQNAIKSFILLSGSDKLSFLEKFAFSNTDLKGIKDKCRDQINTKNEELINITARLQLANDLADETEEPEFIDYPYDEYQTVEQARKCLIQITDAITAKNNRIKIAEDELTRMRISHTKIEMNNSEISRIDEELKTLSQTFPCGFVGNDKLKYYMNQLAAMYDMRELTSLQDTYSKDKKTLDEMIDNEISDNRRMIEDLSVELWMLYTREELTDLIVSTETLLRDAKRIEKLKNMNNGDKTLDELNILLVSLESDHHICPSCNTGLLLRNDVLTMCKTKPSKICDRPDISSVKKSIETLNEIDDITNSYEDDIPLVESIIEDLTYLKEYEFSQIQNEKTVKSLNRKLKRRELSHTCLTFEQKVDTLKERIASLDIKTVHSTDMTEASMRELVDEQKRIKFETDDINSKIYDYEDLKKTYIESNSRLVNGDIDDSIIYLDKLRNDVELLINDQKNIDKRVIFEENREQMNEKLKIYQKIEARVLKLQKEETLRRSEYGALLTLKENILEAESIAITSIVESINTHAKVYLDEFFEADPITVRLQAFKHVKKTIKPQINIEIEYKDMECDLQMMSGGEMARVILAYTLALAEMFNTPLLLLDECTASLDQETTSDVFDAIKENFNGKLTIIVAHQVVTGIFDRSIDLK